MHISGKKVPSTRTTSTAQNPVTKAEAILKPDEFVTVPQSHQPASIKQSIPVQGKDWFTNATVGSTLNAQSSELARLRGLVYHLPAWDMTLDWSDARYIVELVVRDGTADPDAVKAIAAAVAEVQVFGKVSLTSRTNRPALNWLMDRLLAACPNSLDTAPFTKVDGSVDWNAFIDHAAAGLDFTGESLRQLPDEELLKRLNAEVGLSRSIEFTSVEREDGTRVTLHYQPVPADGSTSSLTAMRTTASAVEYELNTYPPQRAPLVDGKPAIKVFEESMWSGKLEDAERALARLESFGEKLTASEARSALIGAVSYAGGSRFLERILKLGANETRVKLNAEVSPGTDEFFSPDAFDALLQAAWVNVPTLTTDPDEQERLQNIETLLRFQVDPNRESPSTLHSGANGPVRAMGGATALILLSQWSTDARLIAANALLRAGANPNYGSQGVEFDTVTNRGISEGETALVVAKRLGDTKLSEVLIQHGAIAFDRDAEARAAWGAHGEELVALLARPDVRHDRVARLNYLPRSSGRPQEPVTSYLELRKAGLDVNARIFGVKGVTEGALAGWHGYSQASLKDLIDAGFPADRAVLNGKTLLQHYATGSPNGPYLTDLNEFLALGADPNARSPDGKTALMYGAYSTAVTTSLIARGADVNVIDDSGRTALFYACAKDSEGVIEQLLQHGADPNVPIAAHRNLPLWAAIMSLQLSSHQNGYEERDRKDGYQTFKQLISSSKLEVDLSDLRITELLREAQTRPALRAIATWLQNPARGTIEKIAPIVFTGAQEGILAQQDIDVYQIENGQLTMNDMALGPVGPSHILIDENRLVFAPKYSAQDLKDIRTTWTQMGNFGINFALNLKDRFPKISARMEEGVFFYDISTKRWTKLQGNEVEHRSLLDRVYELEAPVREAKRNP